MPHGLRSRDEQAYRTSFGWGPLKAAWSPLLQWVCRMSAWFHLRHTWHNHSLQKDAKWQKTNMVIPAPLSISSVTMMVVIGSGMPSNIYSSVCGGELHNKNICPWVKDPTLYRSRARDYACWKIAPYRINFEKGLQSWLEDAVINIHNFNSDQGVFFGPR